MLSQNFKLKIYNIQEKMLNFKLAHFFRTTYFQYLILYSSITRFCNILITF
jgi:hypothetical protein